MIMQMGCHVVHRFKDGLHLRRRADNVEFIPVYLNNLNRILPKGEFLPLPLLDSVLFGSPLPVLPDEPKAAFLDRARQSRFDLDQS
ncbi:MAG TPA: hypothetical protein VJL29_10440 [Thermoguttaceae bacterium]|nr:hypothetical protein [Thermoguttaceae bacterium]